MLPGHPTAGPVEVGYGAFLPPNPPQSSRKRKVSDLNPFAAPSISSSAAFHDPGGLGEGSGAYAEPTSSTQSAKKSRTNTPWSPAEEQRLKNMRDAGSSWSEIAKTFPTRTEGSVKKHWYKDMHYAEFAEDESAALLTAIKEYEASKWKVIGQKVGKPAKEAETRTIELKEDDPYMVWRMILYLYCLDYNDLKVVLPSGVSSEDFANNAILINVHMYTMGDKYGIGGLKKVAEAKFEDAVKQMENPLQFLPAVVKIYKSTPAADRGLRDVTVRLATLSVKSLMASTTFKEIVVKVPEFACDVINWTSKNATKPATTFLTSCRGCHKNTYGKIEKLRCAECTYLKSAEALSDFT
ncbi:MAG: hypothetical protein M1830_010199 [Pleopsidium flavum]|nr:MAG: hypothetical protein M1830_010199 [Pleopsidium flavum]